LHTLTREKVDYPGMTDSQSFNKSRVSNKSRESQIKSNHLFRQADTKKNVDKMSNEKA